MKFTLSILIVIIFLGNITYGQYSRLEYCLCEKVGEKDVNYLNDTIYAKAFVQNDILNIELYNYTDDTIYLFKSYFEDNISRSNLLYSYDTKNNIVVLSFVPFITYLYTIYSDRYISNNRIVQEYQTVYDFYKIPPNYKHCFTLNILDFNKKLVYYKYIEVENKRTYLKSIKFKKINLPKKFRNDYIVEFAYYVNVNVICNKDMYYRNLREFITHAQQFKVIKTKILFN